MSLGAGRHSSDERIVPADRIDIIPPPGPVAPLCLIQEDAQEPPDPCGATDAYRSAGAIGRPEPARADLTI